MPKCCKDCDMWYNVAREKRPKIFCTWCKVGKHDCIQVKDLEKKYGIKWFCGKYNDLFTSQIQSKNQKKNISLLLVWMKVMKL